MGSIILYTRKKIDTTFWKSLPALCKFQAGGFLHPFEKYARQIGSFPQTFGAKIRTFELPPTNNTCWNLRKLQQTKLGNILKKPWNLPVYALEILNHRDPYNLYFIGILISWLIFLSLFDWVSKSQDCQRRAWTTKWWQVSLRFQWHSCLGSARRNRNLPWWAGLPTQLG